ncbi:unnamed protein product [Phytophthora fragariaefolia]|uniref:Unnamed protein product n=1 Tax=Phytophthora fragariaefolia TaxID=1490495 RepID=A0A9W6XKY3_9STRA|nr:unnamed protein product [Phytophthora fragariaefolia]
MDCQHPAGQRRSHMGREFDPLARARCGQQPATEPQVGPPIVHPHRAVGLFKNQELDRWMNDPIEPSRNLNNNKNQELDRWMSDPIQPSRNVKNNKNQEIDRWMNDPIESSRNLNNN